MREIQVGPKPEDTVLLVKYQGNYYCMQSKCPHFGFPMIKGVLVGDKVICPLHNAGFSVQTGYPEQGPILDGLRTFPVRVENEKVVVSVPKVGWENKPERPPLGEWNIDRSKKMVIIGAGPAAISAAETMRAAGYKGFIYMVAKEEGKNGITQSCRMTGRCSVNSWIRPKSRNPSAALSTSSMMGSCSSGAQL
jgi:nitrite reductase/ring-hydroxylating ferredoxin subunit